MARQRRTELLRFVKGSGIALGVLGASLLWLFPGPRFGLALTLAAGLGRDALQSRIDAIESKAIRKRPLSEPERAFLVDFYSTLATGAKLTVVVRQTGNLMSHYLGKSGEDFELDPVIFTSNAKVEARARLLRKRAARAPCQEGRRFESPVFHMPDRSNIDSVFGLYDGSLVLTQHAGASGGCVNRFRAEVPWAWPSYESLRSKYGDPHAESFPLPNALSLAFGRRYALFVDNGLGHHLEEVGLAKSFLAFAEWSEDEE
jgi:hypothetical protein